MIRFELITGDTGDLPTNANHLNFKWLEPGCNVLFSVTKHGNAASCHFSSDKAGMKKIKKACKEFIDFVFWMFDWCNVIIAKVERKKIKSLIKTLGFVKVFGSNTNKSIYAFKRGV